MPESAGTLRRRLEAVVVFCVLVGAWVVVFLTSGTLQLGPGPKHLGGDFALFVSAAKVIQDGGNPYDQRVLYQGESRLLLQDGLRPPRFDPYMRVGNPPLLFWVLRPIATVSFDSSAKAWCLAMYGLLGLGFLGCLVAMDWRRRWLPLLVFLALPQAMYAAYYGNVDGIVFAALAWSVVLARRRPFLAGALLTLCLLKPQVAIPGALLIMLFLSPQRLRSLGGFVTASSVALLLTVATTGTASIGWWLQALGGYSQRLGVQPDIASLSGLYVYSASDRVRLMLEGLSLLAVVIATVAWWWRRQHGGDQVLGVAWLWIAWFLATPFAHFHDEVVLALPILAVVGRNAMWMGRWPATVALYVLLFSILVFPTTRAHTDLQSLTLLIVLACSLAQRSREQAAPEDEDAARASSMPAWD
jgi:Glycosyltransferase family 87